MEPLNEESEIACPLCEIKYPLKCYPKKGRGRYEKMCKTCHNKSKRDKRVTSVSKWSIENITIRENWIEKPGCLVNSLHSLLMIQNEMPSQSESIDSILRSHSSVQALLND